MKTLQQHFSTSAKKGITRREGLMLTLLSSALVLAGCGGGGGDSSPASGSLGSVTGSSASGAITGFGSIIVGGVRYDDSKASVKDDDGVNKSSGDLKMGMVVKIKGGKKSGDGFKAEANSIEIYSELVGPIDSVTATSIVVLGQTVDILATTFFEDGLTFASLETGNVVEVYGFVNPGTGTVAGTMAATRIERKTNASKFKLQGAISALNTATKTFRIGPLVIAYINADIPVGLTLADGTVVRVRLDITPLTGTRTALKIRALENKHDDADEAEVEGIITAFTSRIIFSVNGLPVDASTATFENANMTLALGDRVEIEGRVVNGVLVARKVELEDDEDGEDYAEDMYKFELHGLVSGLDKTARTFVLRGVLVTYTVPAVGAAMATLFNDGATLANFANGNKVEIKGTLRNGNMVMATKISLES